MAIRGLLRGWTVAVGLAFFQHLSVIQAVTLAWDANPETDIAGYRLFWGETNSTAVVRDAGNTTQAEVTNLTAGRTYFFYLTAYNTSGLESDPSSSVFYTQAEAVPSVPSNFAGTAESQTQIRLQWSDNSDNETGFRLLRRAASSESYTTNFIPANVTIFTDGNLTPDTEYFYSLRAYNSAGESAETAEISVRTPTPPPLSGGARFLAADWNSGGSWKLDYGRDGYVLVGDSQKNPSYATVTASGQGEWMWQWETTDSAALERSGSALRLAACWYATTPYVLDVPLSGPGPYRLSIYCLDWDMNGRMQQVEILDPGTGQILNSQSISNFMDGVYLTWEITKPVRVRVTPVAGANAVVSGVFFDSVAAVARPEFSPNGGTFAHSISVAISSDTVDAMIRYTLDGSLPTTNSPAYAGPMTLTNSVTITARAFKSGLAPSIASSATFTLSGGTADRVRFMGADTTRGGSWRDSAGSQGQMIAYETPGLPSYASMTFDGASTWIWSFPATSPAALERPYQSGRIASTWYGSTFAANLTLKDTLPHRISFYFVDFDGGGRVQTVEIVDPGSGAVLDAVELSDFASGIWLEYEMIGSVTVRLSRVAGANAVWSGIFFD